MGEGEHIELNKRDQEMTQEFNPEFKKQKIENPITFSLLKEIHEKGEKPSFYTFLSFLDSRESDLENRKADTGPVDRMRETVLDIVSGRKNHITPRDIDYITTYLTDYATFWEDNAKPETPAAQQTIANNNTSIFEAFKDFLVEKEIYKGVETVYPGIALKPNNTLEVLIKPQEKKPDEASGERTHTEEPNVEGFLFAAGKDNTAMKEEAPWPDFRLAVDEARKYYEGQKSSYENQKKKGKSLLIAITIKDGKVAGSPAWSTDVDADPANGVYLFNPQGYEANPLSLDSAAKTADEFDKRGERVGTALKAWEKVEKGEKIDDNQKLAITQILDEHEEYLTEQEEGDKKPAGLEALETMIDFVIGKLGLEPRAKREQDITPDDLSAATGRPPVGPEMPADLGALTALFGGMGGMQGGNQN